MTCRELVDFLMDYLEGGLDPRVRSRFEGHVSACPSCETYLATYRETLRLGHRLLCEPPDGAVPDEVPEDLVAAILAARSGAR
jgi:anti-sigma factor RsiW